MSFDRLAPHYRWMEQVFAGQQLQRCRTAFLNQIPSCRQVLVAGEGNGRFLAACRRRLPEARITCVDGSRKMLALAQERLRRQELPIAHVEFIQADIRQWPAPTATFDLVVTHFFLDCFPAQQVAEIVVRLARATQPGAHWLVADFCVPEQGWKRLRARAVVGGLYGFFRLTTGLAARQLTPPDPWLDQAGFQLRQRNPYDWGLLQSDWWTRRER